MTAKDNPLLVRFEELLASEGELRGLIGPREVPRLRDRHILNSAVLSPFISKKDGILVDVGSGAGFPGIVLACLFPDLQIYLVESMQRRCQWLEFVKEELSLTNVTVVRGRAEDVALAKLVPPADFATARAVAPLKKLIPWLAPFLAPGGEFIALKGEKASEEILEARKTAQKFALSDLKIEPAGSTCVVRATKRGSR